MSRPPTMKVSLFTRALVGAAVAKVVVALVAILSAVVRGPVVQHGAPLNTLWTLTLLVVTYASVGVTLPRLARNDPRAEAFGAYLLLIATAFSRVLLVSGTQFGVLTATAVRLRIDMFQPLFLWLFVRDFPFRIPLGWRFGWPSRFIKASVVFGVATFAINLVKDLGGAYWPISFLLMLPAGPFLLERARHVSPGDRRRVWLFVGAMTAGLTPIAVDVLLQSLIPGWLARESRVPWNWVPFFVLAALLSVPLTTAYSVVIERVLDLTLMVRAAMQYALARLTIFAIIAVPGLWALWSMYRTPSHTIVDVVSARPVSLATAFLVLAVILPTRQRIINQLDRTFFREHYDSEVILTELVEATRHASSVTELASLLSTQVSRALHPLSIAVLIRRDDRSRFESPGGASRSLPTTSTLASLLGSSDDPLKIEPEHPKSILRRLDAETVAWVADGNFRMLVPLRGATGTLMGFIALGEKKSELPYSKRDHGMLTALGATVGFWLDAHATESGSRWERPPTGAPDSAAKECPVCGRVYTALASVCPCGGTLVEASVPEVLAGKFRIERRVGAGGMGVVYQAHDEALGRTVAVKALRGSNPRQAWRLRREAQVMSLMTHPNLAIVFGLEFWFGQPLLVSEFVAGGTLADRIAQHGPLPMAQVGHIGVTLAEVLGTLHTSGLLHRDVKPANIGFAADGEVKLLDFGLARAFKVADTDTGHDTETAKEASSLDSTGTERGHIVGTPAYMSPEALSGERHDARVDLWSLAVTMFEAMTGMNPFRGLPVSELMRVRPTPDPREFAAGCSRDAAAFFAEALAQDRDRRPANADAFAELILSRLLRSSDVL